MDTLPTVLHLLVAQGVMGAFDTIYHHELRAALPKQLSAVFELRIHAVRALLYGVVFAGLAWFVWGGAWVLLLVVIIAIEVCLTLWDFLVEDQTRLLPKSERVLHTILAINGGATFGLFAFHAPSWWAMPNELQFVSYGWQSIVISVFALGVTVSSIRDWLASLSLMRRRRDPKFSFASEPQSVLITGGTGFIGQLLCRALLADGHAVTLLARDPIKAAYLYQGRVRCIRSMAELDPAFRIDVFINLAGAPIVGRRWTATRKEQLIQSRVATTESLVAWISRAKQKPRLLISTSAVGYYGVQTPDDPTTLTESSPSQAIFVSELCRRWENAALAARDYDVPVAILRLGLVFGYQGVLPALLRPFLLGIGGRIGNGKQPVSWVHIDDVLGVIAHVMTDIDSKHAGGTYNVTAPHSVSQATFAKVIGKIWHRPSAIPLPAIFLRLALGEQATLMLDGQRVYPKKLEERGYRFRFPRLESALLDLKGETL